MGGIASGASMLTRRPVGDGTSSWRRNAPIESEVVERGWPQVVDEAADVVERGGDVGPDGADQLVGLLGAGGQQGPRGVEPKRRGGQGRAEAVVQVAAQPAPFVLDRDDEPFA